MRYLPLLFATLQLFGNGYRNYTQNTPDHVKQTYRDNHIQQTLEFVIRKKAEYFQNARFERELWAIFSQLEDFKDESDPDTELPQIVHAFQTAEAIRKDGHPRWLILAGLIHDLGKVLYLFGEPQWAVVGDTFPVGCAFDPAIVFHNYFLENPDSQNPKLQTKLGIYEESCGLENVHMSFGHDEYLYWVMKPHLPEKLLYIIRYHSFYAGHRAGAYPHLLNDHDREMMPYLKLFSKYDLYSKTREVPDINKLMPYYKELVREFFGSENPRIVW